jgi:anti-sigma factor RsiW
MKPDRENALELMALVDGQLEGEAKARVERRLETDAHARELVARMEDVRVKGWLADAVDERAVRGGADQIADAVLARLGGSGGRHRFSRGRARGGILALAAAAAIAAAIPLFAVVRRAPLRDSVSPVTAVDPRGSTSSGSSSAGVELDEIDSPSHDVSVFEISGAAVEVAANTPAPSSVVIWIDDEPGSP